MNLVTIADLAHRPTEAVLGFEQHGFGVAVLRLHPRPPENRTTRACPPACPRSWPTTRWCGWRCRNWERW